MKNFHLIKVTKNLTQKIDLRIGLRYSECYLEVSIAFGPFFSVAESYSFPIHICRPTEDPDEILTPLQPFTVDS
jgi:hypothetical protein